MASSVTDKVFEKKNTRIKAFVKYTIRYGIYLAVIFGALVLYAYNKGVDNPLGFAKYYWLLFAAVSVIGIIVNTAKEKDINVTVMSKTVDITVGGENSVHPVTEFVGPYINTKKKKSQQCELVFAEDENDPESMHFTPLPGFTAKEFMNICDAIMIAKKELAGEAQYKAFEGDLYEKNSNDGYDGKLYFLLVLTFGIPISFIVFMLMGILLKHNVWHYSFPMTLCLVFFVFFLVKLIRYLIEIGPIPKKLKTLKFSNSGYEINGVSYSYKAIETVTMTQPYLMGFSAYHRELTIKLFDSKKPLRFSLGNRIEKDETEEEIGKGNTCIYPALYERIKTDKALDRKFKI